MHANLDSYQKSAISSFGWFSLFCNLPLIYIHTYIYKNKVSSSIMFNIIIIIHCLCPPKTKHPWPHIGTTRAPRDPFPLTRARVRAQNQSKRSRGAARSHTSYLILFLRRYFFITCVIIFHISREDMILYNLYPENILRPPLLIPNIL